MIKNNLQQLFILTWIVIPAIAHCNILEEIYCFDSSPAGSKNFGLHVLYSDTAKWSGAFVKYRGAKSAITLVLKDERAEEISVGRPDQVATTWYEVYGGKVAGEY